MNDIDRAIIAILTHPMRYTEIEQALLDVGCTYSASRIRNSLRSLWKHGIMRREPQSWGYLYSLEKDDPFAAQHNTKATRCRTLIEYNGDLLTYEELAECTGCKASVIKDRIHKGWSMDRVLTIGNAKHKVVDIDGEEHNLTEWCEILHVNRKTIQERVRRGMTYKEALLYERPPIITMTIDGQEYTANELSERTGIPARVLRDRYRKGERGNDLIRPKKGEHE